MGPKASSKSATSAISEEDFQESVFLEEKERVLFQACQNLDTLLKFLQEH